MQAESTHHQGVRARLAEARGGLTDGRAQVEFARSLAAELWERAQALRDADERARDRVLSAMMADANGQAFTTLITDRAFRTQTPRKLASALSHLLRELGVPTYLTGLERLQLQVARRLGWLFAGAVARGVDRRVRAESAHLLLVHQRGVLESHLAERRTQGVRVNLNHLGEAVLGEAEAERRREAYRALLARPDVEAISIKLSSISSQVDLTAYDHTLEMLAPRLREIYRVAQAHTFTRADGTEVPKLVNLDMEAYRDMVPTLEVFRRVLDEPEFQSLTAGVVLQAYLPDAAAQQRTLTAWAQARTAGGGAPIRLRIVKGANLATESVESSLRGWALPIYPDKLSVDANFKRMLRFGCQPERARAVNLGIASHNVFDLAYGLTLRAHHGVEAHVGLELLSGMAEPLRRALCEVCQDVLVYAPAVEVQAMHSAIAYLVRRLDENTGPENFLHHSFGMGVMDAAFNAQADAFARAAALCDDEGFSQAPRRTQDRNAEAPRRCPETPFGNEPDTDFTLPQNRRWLSSQLARARDAEPREIPLQIAGEACRGVGMADGFDPSRPGHVPYRHALAGPRDIERALNCAQRAQAQLRAQDMGDRCAMLADVAHALRNARGELLGCMVLDGGKRPEQADTEISEAIDFAEYYPKSLRDLQSPDVQLRGRGVTVVTPPWNFPIAIPAGGVLAALAAGNPVILKPAPETVLVAATLARLCWEAGVPRALLQLLLCEDDVGSALVRDPRVSALILTGATETARLFQRMRPDLYLLAETGGKNGLIVTALADRDQAVRDVVHSAFGHAGQKCSAASLLVLEAEVYEDPTFREQLRDAAASLPVGSAWAPEHVVTPLIRPPGGPLARALSSLDEGESWLLSPRVDPDNPRLVSPGIRWGVARDSFCHRTELFGPVLSVMRADDLYDAIDLVNATGYGLTAGLSSLDEREQARYLRRIRAGNVYINRGMTGAIVRRQAFGGYGDSNFGPGAKAGGPNYALQLVEVQVRSQPAVAHPPTPAAAELLMAAKPLLTPEARRRLSQAACDFGAASAQYFDLDHDPSGVIGERNLFRYLPRDGMVLRWAPDTDAAPGHASNQENQADQAAALEAMLLAACAALTAGARCSLSLPESAVERHPTLKALGPLKVLVESAEALAARVGSLQRLRVVGTPEQAVAAACLEAGVHLDRSPVLSLGRFELLKYYREQSISIAYHRHGNLAGERLLPPLRRPAHPD